MADIINFKAKPKQIETDFTLADILDLTKGEEDYLTLILKDGKFYSIKDCAIVKEGKTIILKI